MMERPEVKRIRPRPKRRIPSQPKAGWGLVAMAAQRLGLWDSLCIHAARRAFAVACHQLVPRLEPHARAESLEGEGRTLVVRVSSSAVASELVYVKDLLLEQVNAQLATLAPSLEKPRARGKRILALRLERLQYRVGPVKALPDYASWVAIEARSKDPPAPPRVSWDLEVAAALKQVADEGTRDALAALYAAATQITPAPKKA